MVYLTRQASFSAGHRYFLPELSEEENLQLFGACANRNGHGHDYRCEVTVGGEVDAETGMVINLTDLKQLLLEVVVEPLDGEFLTIDHPVCRGRVPTSENLVRYLWQGLESGLAALMNRVQGTGLATEDTEVTERARVVAGRQLGKVQVENNLEPANLQTCNSPASSVTSVSSVAKPVRLHRVRLAESRWLYVDCLRKEEEPTVFLTRSYEFSAAHRLHSARLSDEKNLELYGKCNNPYGHGHNYRLEVTVQGDIDERTGMMVDIAYLDRVVEKHVVRRYDHKNLNLDIPEFAERNPTSENLVKVIWERLAPHLKHPPLYRVTVRETERNSFSFYGEGE